METYRYSRWLKWLAYAAWPLFIGLATLSTGQLLFGSEDADQKFGWLAVAVLCGWLAIASYPFLCRLGNVLVVGDEGITVRSGSDTVTILWRDIARVRARDFMQKLVLHDYYGRPLLEVDYEISDFYRLRKRIFDGRVFRNSWGFRMLLSGMALLLVACAGWSGEQGRDDVMLLFVGLAIIVHGARLWHFDSYHVERDRLVLRAPGRARDVHYAEITDVELRTVAGTNGQAVPTVFLHRRGEKPVMLHAIEGGAIAFVEALRDAWERYHGGAPAPVTSYVSPTSSTNEFGRGAHPALWLLPACFLVLVGYQRLHDAEQYPPLPLRATAVDDSLFRPVVPPPVDPFGYPAITVDKRLITRLLAAGEYAVLEKLLSTLRNQVHDDIRHEYNLEEAYLAFDRSDPELETQLNAWLEARPGSSEVRFARARYFLERAWTSRGYRYMRHTTREQIQGMRHFAGLAEHELAAGFALDSANLMAYVIHLGVLQIHGSTRTARAVRDRALRIFPTSFTIRSVVMNSMQPRWGGSYRQMDRFAEQAASFAGQNSRLLALRGYALAERGYTHLLAGRYDAALHFYNQALAHGGHWTFHRDRGRTYYHAEDYARALEDLVRAAAQQPYDPEILSLKGKTLYRLSAALPPGPRSAALDQAIAHFNVVQAIQPSNETAAEWLQFLQEKRASQQVELEPPVGTR